MTIIIIVCPKSQLGWLNLPHLLSAVNYCQTTNGHNSKSAWGRDRRLWRERLWKR